MLITNRYKKHYLSFFLKDIFLKKNQNKVDFILTEKSIYVLLEQFFFIKTLNFCVWLKKLIYRY